MRLENPLIVQSDHTILAEVASPRYPEARDALVGFAELVKSPEHVHSYRVTPLSIWNARAAGHEAEAIVGVLRDFSKYPVPESVERSIRDFASRYGRVRLLRADAGPADHADHADAASADAAPAGGDPSPPGSPPPPTLLLVCDAEHLAEELLAHREVAPHLGERVSPTAFTVAAPARGQIKQALIRAGWPAEDLGGYTRGQSLAMELLDRGPHPAFTLRPYQSEAVDAFHAAGSDRGGSGVIVLPCGAGKTVVGMACMARYGATTLVLTTGVTAAEQWVRELLARTTLEPEQVGVYHGQAKEIRPVTVATYQVLTHRPSREGGFPHLSLFDALDWGLIIYDEVHLLPAPVFQVTAGLQARRRLGLTATLVREDGREDDVFALIGPKKMDVPWKTLERAGWIAEARCTEFRVEMDEELRLEYAVAEARRRFRIAAENPRKNALVDRILQAHPGEPTLILGMYVAQLRSLAGELGVPVLTGSTPQAERDRLYAAFRAGREPVLAVSKVANFALDLPDAAVAIQVSGTFGSRQEEAQRLGRILRPKGGSNTAHFYTLVTRETVEQEFALRRQLFLCEQGYTYAIADAGDLEGEASPSSPEGP